jgi:DNA-binding transcriptional LysR family regulator
MAGAGKQALWPARSGAAVARELDLTPQALALRLKVIESRLGRWYR